MNGLSLLLRQCDCAALLIAARLRGLSIGAYPMLRLSAAALKMIGGVRQ